VLHGLPNKIAGKRAWLKEAERNGDAGLQGISQKWASRCAEC
jgi:hypothetical protein